jgi:pSer/pThr/pTyr-binding forkhead associated (FHA) protein
LQAPESLTVEVTLEVKTGPLAGTRVPLHSGQLLVVGRAPTADLSLPHDSFVSSVHFALEAQTRGCHLADRNSSNGTFLNGARVTEAMVRDGDEIRAGQTTFVVHIVEPKEVELPQPPSASPGAVPTHDRASANVANRGLQIGGWSLRSVPSGWELLEQQGIRRAGKDVFPSNAVVTEEELPQDKTLQQYIDSQLFLMDQVIPQVKHGAPAQATISGAAEAFALEVRFRSDDGRPVVQRQVYARAGRLVGILTFTTLEEELPMMQPVFDFILRGFAFHSRE